MQSTTETIIEEQPAIAKKNWSKPSFEVIGKTVVENASRPSGTEDGYHPYNS